MMYIETELIIQCSLHNPQTPELAIILTKLVNPSLTFFLKVHITIFGNILHCYIPTKGNSFYSGMSHHSYCQHEYLKSDGDSHLHSILESLSCHNDHHYNFCKIRHVGDLPSYITYPCFLKNFGDKHCCT